jgi:hypothetical protein
MAKIRLVCPFCDMKVETSDDNVGREGQCPGCENVFRVTDPRKGGGLLREETTGWGAGAPREYQDGATMGGVVAAAVGLLILAIVGFLSWTRRTAPTRVADLILGQSMPFAVVSIVCLAIMVVSVLGRKSLMPAVMVSGAWGMICGFWIASAWGALGREANGMILLTGLLGAALVVGSVIWIFYQAKQIGAYPRMGVVIITLLVVGFVVGGMVYKLHVEPEIRERMPRELRRPAGSRPGR